MAKIRRSRAKRLVLDIGSSSIRLCELSQTKAGFQLNKYYQREVLCDPAEDEEKKRQARVAAIKALIKEARVRTRKTILSVPGRSVFTRARTLPPVPEYKVSQIVGYEIRQQIPFPLEQIALDYQILNRTESGSYDVMMAAIKVDVVEKHLEVLKETKSAIDVVDVSPFAAYNWLKHTGEFGTDGECVALLDLGAGTTEIVIERGNQFRFTRPLNMGGNDITAALKTALNSTFAEAEKFKRERAFAPTGDPARDGKMGEVLNPVLSRLVGEISRSFGYFRSLPGGGMVDRVIVTGGGACLRNMVPYLQRQLGIEVRIVRPLAGVAVGANAQQANEHPEQACVALGMALRCCQPTAIEINLIPPRILESARRKEQALYWVLSFIVLGMIAASIIPARDQKDKLVQEQIARLKKVISKYDPAVAENPDTPSDFVSQYEEAKRHIDENLQKMSALNERYEKAEFFLDKLKLLNDLRPPGAKVWFSSVETTNITEGGQTNTRGRGRPGGLFANRGAAGSSSTGVNSTGFPGISSGSSSGIASRSFGGFAKKQRRTKNQTPTVTVPRVNGFRIMGYAKDDEALMEFIDNLKKYDGEEPKIYKVHFSEANAEPVPITEMQKARVADRVVSRSTTSSRGSGNEDGRRSFGTGLRGLGGNLNTRRATPVPTYSQYVEQVVFFQLDIQFEGPPAPQQNQQQEGTAGAAGAAGQNAAPNPFLRFKNFRNKGASQKNED